MPSSEMEPFDYIVIGSGFGGSVSALRLAEKGYRVAVLEKGKRYRPQDFAKTNWNFRRYFWMPKLHFYGIQCLALLRNAFILHGAGVGGGSLVYANNLLIPPDQVFQKPGWGPGDWQSKLQPHYRAAQRMLGATPAARTDEADRLLAEVSAEIRSKDTFHINDVGVYFGEPGKTVEDPFFNGEGPERTGCTYCGACMVGCRDGGKNTLDKNYLFLAEKRGVEILPEMEVLDVKPNGDKGYTIITQKSTGFRHPQKAFHARGVVFSGGVMGSVKLLLKCKTKDSLPRLSDQLGNFVRTNAEALLAVNARDKDADYSGQIAITSGVYPDAETHMEIVRYPKNSDAMALLSTLLVGGGKPWPRPLRLVGNIIRHPLRFLHSLWPFNWAQRTPIVLVMQTVDNHMRLTFKRRWWRFGKHSFNSTMPKEHKIPSYIPIANKVTKRLAEKMNGRPLSILPEVLFDVTSTAHILGGCRMSETPETGVVDFQGKVHGYDNLYVVDGSIVPVNLGVNPSLTITALAEYVMSHFPENPSHA
ncbi:MAG: GMC family oxidoreductase [Candidatus Marinimicrobia bacterium]|nr:GMC family oxidoreductase [Candidatus Neomarinimicrobiota bacterium]MCF7839247.1 GMC family oxidoreductase [Candidatus Neomarinimicrobiota bacterium]